MSAYDPFRSFTAVGGLLSYGSEQIDNFRRAAIYADNILRGTKPRCQLAGNVRVTPSCWRRPSSSIFVANARLIFRLRSGGVDQAPGIYPVGPLMICTSTCLPFSMRKWP